MNLKTYLLTRIVFAAALSLSATAAYVLYRAHREIDLENRYLSESLGKQLELQLMRIQADIGQSDRFPDFDLWKQTHSKANLCIRYTPSATLNTYDLCQGESLRKKTWPRIFESLYRWVFNLELGISQSIVYNKRDFGRLTVVPDAEWELARAWESLAGLLALSASTVSLVSCWVYFAMRRALRPAQVIADALDKRGTPDDTIHLPLFEFAEWRRIAEAIEHFAADRKQWLAERTRLVVKLMTLQEEERRYLARELHDELGQCLAGVNALSASILQTAERDCPELASEAKDIGRINRRIMETLKMLLGRLRPAEIEALGLAAGLESLISSWNMQTSGRIKFQLGIEGNSREIPEVFAFVVYRVAQEALTNIAKHSTATLARVMLAVTAQAIVLIIEDNGKIKHWPLKEAEGFGVLGMRERVAGLGGEFELTHSPSGGLLLRVRLPGTTNAPAAR